jgi:CO/xanthine dehydrogenase Mo-binding subunit
MSIVGQPIHRIDALGKVTGETLYPGDINMTDQAYIKILFAAQPHAIVRSIDTSKADALPGVIATFTAKDVPVNEYGLFTMISLYYVVRDPVNPILIGYDLSETRWQLWLQNQRKSLLEVAI